MIVTVKFAPTERWCRWAQEDLKRNPALQSLPGREIRIYTESFKIQIDDDNNTHASWRVFEEDLPWFREITGSDWTVTRTCEHLLDMD